MRVVFEEVSLEKGDLRYRIVKDKKSLFYIEVKRRLFLYVIRKIMGDHLLYDKALMRLCIMNSKCRRHI